MRVQGRSDPLLTLAWTSGLQNFVTGNLRRVSPFWSPGFGCKAVPHLRQ